MFVIRWRLHWYRDHAAEQTGPIGNDKGVRIGQGQDHFVAGTQSIPLQHTKQVGRL